MAEEDSGAYVPQAIASPAEHPAISSDGQQEAASSSAEESKALDAEVEKVVARFSRVDRDALTEELQSFQGELNVAALEQRIQEYSTVEESLQTRLGSQLIANYDGFVRGMEHVQQVDSEFAFISMKIKNSRRRLKEADEGIVEGGCYIARQKQRHRRLCEVIELLGEVSELLKDRELMEESAAKEKFHEAIKINAHLLQVLRSDKFRPGGGFDEQEGAFGDLRDRLRKHLEDIKQTLRTRMMEAAVRAEVDFDATRYEEVLEACGASDFAAL